MERYECLREAAVDDEFHRHYFFHTAQISKERPKDILRTSLCPKYVFWIFCTVGYIRLVIKKNNSFSLKSGLWTKFSKKKSCQNLVKIKRFTGSKVISNHSILFYILCIYFIFQLHNSTQHSSK